MRPSLFRLHSNGVFYFRKFVMTGETVVWRIAGVRRVNVNTEKQRHMNGLEWETVFMNSAFSECRCHLSSTFA